MLADRAGRLEYRPKRWKAEIFPYDDVDIVELFNELVRNGLVEKYDVDESVYVWITKFTTHQKPHQREQPSVIPAHPADIDGPQIKPNNDQGETQAQPRQCQGETQAQSRQCRARLNPDILNPDILNPEEENILHGPAPKNASDTYRTKRGRKLAGQKLAWFSRFWGAFSYPKGKAEAADAWLDIPDLTPELVDRIVLAATAEAAARAEAMAQGKTPKMAQGWISGRRWEDEALAPSRSPGIDVAAVAAALEKRRAMQ